MKIFSKRVFIKAGVLFVIYGLLYWFIVRRIPEAIVGALLMTGIDELMDVLICRRDWEEYIQSLEEKEEEK